MSAEQRLQELGYTLPPPWQSKGMWVTTRLADRLLYTGGLVAFAGEDLTKIQYRGKLGRELTVQDGFQSARLAALNLLSVLKEELGDLDRVEHIVKLTVFVNCTPEFTKTPQVADGASEVLLQVFGDAGKHARSAIGVNSLPEHCSVEVEMVVQLRR